jgi:hypothetical protein
MDNKNVLDEKDNSKPKQIQVKRLADPRKPRMDKEEIYSILALAQIGFIDFRNDPFMLAQLHLAQIETENKRIIHIHSQSKISHRRKVIKLSLEILAVIVALGIGITFIVLLDKKL